MTVLRELVARLGFQVDKSGFVAAERGVAGIKNALGATSGVAAKTQAGLAVAGAKAAALGKDAKKAAAGVGAASSAMGAMGKLVAAAGLTHVIQGMVEMASDANETGNILNELFGPAGAQQVKSWSDAMASAMGRSKYDLQAYAGRLGAVISPMVKNQEKAQEFSTSLSALAVDLGSFFNSSDEEALNALRSGMTGEAEAMKKYGIVMNDVTLTEFAHTQGIKKKLKAMSIAEKTELRYGFIMQATKTAQGDAARTSEGYANSLKALKSGFKDLGTEMGMSVIPKVEKLVRLARDGIVQFKKFAEGTALLDSAMYVLVGSAAALGLSLMAPFILPAIALVALIALADELNALFTGGKSVLGDWLDKLGGLGTADKLVHNVTEGFKALMDVVSHMPDIVGSFQLLVGVAEDIGLAFDLAAKKMNPFKHILEAGAASDRAIYSALGLKPNQAEAQEDERAKGRGMDAPLATSVGEQLDMVRAERYRNVQRDSEARAASLAAGRANAIEAERRANMTPATAAAASVWDVDPNAVQFGRARVGAAAAAPAAPLPGWGEPNMTYNTTIHIHGGDERKVEQTVTKVLDKHQRKTRAAVSGPGGG